MIDADRRIRQDAAALATACEQGANLPVPSCPGWTVADVTGHVGAVHRLFAEALRGGWTERPQIEIPRPEVAALPAWVRDGAGELVAALESADPERPVWNWTGTPEGPDWVRRRMLHETAVHRWDAASASDGFAAAPVPPEVAADGIDEFFDVIMAHRTEPWEGAQVTVRLAQVDGPDHWLVRTRGGRPGVEVVHDTAEAETQVQASASDLMLLLWRRLPVEKVACTGDRRALDGLLAWTRL